MAGKRAPHSCIAWDQTTSCERGLTASRKPSLKRVPVLERKYGGLLERGVKARGKVQRARSNAHQEE